MEGRGGKNDDEEKEERFDKRNPAPLTYPAPLSFTAAVFSLRTITRF